MHHHKKHLSSNWMAAVYQICCRKDSFGGWEERLEHITKDPERYCAHQDICWLPRKREISSPLRRPRVYLAPGSPRLMQADPTSNPPQRTPSRSRIGFREGHSVWFMVVGLFCCVSDPAPKWQETDFSDGFLHAAQFGRTDAMGQASSHKFPGNNS